MKTRVHFMIVTGLYLALSITLLSNALIAQTVICTDTAADDKIIMKIQGTLPESVPDKIVLQFDNASLSFELNRFGELAFVSGSGLGAPGASLYSFADLFDVLVEEKMALETWMTKPIVVNDEAKEEKIELEDWMLSTKNW